MGRLRRIRSLEWREITDLLVAQGSLLAAWWTVQRRPKGELLRRIQSLVQSGDARDERRLARLAVAVDRISRFGMFRPTCLVRAVALERQIRSANAGAAVVRVGVLLGGTKLLAHAWIEIDGRVVGDEPSHVRRFTPLHDFTSLPR